MPSARKRLDFTPGLAAYVPAPGAALLAMDLSTGPALSRVGRTLLELTGAHRGAAVLFDRQGALSGLLRGARDIGLEPRVVAPAGAPGLGLRRSRYLGK